MKAERNQQIDQVFQAALACEPTERGGFLDGACANDPDLRLEVESLLAADEQASDFIESPALEMAPELVADDRSKTVSGKTIGPYRLDQRLGAGGMGKVYLAHDIRLGRKVALKLLDLRLLDDTEQRTRFLREARLASVLDHPNICTIHQVGEAAGRLFIAMQYVEGQTLKQVINGRPLNLDCLLSVSLQVADALSAAHAQGIIHRDIKAGNIIVTPCGQAKVLDFGLAKLLERTEEEDTGADLTMTGAVMGTPSSMSPEQARGERTDHRSDIFSFGVVMYEMATGSTPFKGTTRADVIDSLLHQSHKPAMELNKDIPAKLSAVIDRALAKEPAQRYQSMTELMADLRQVVTEAGGMDQLFNSSEAQFRMMPPYVAPRQRKPIKLFGRKIQRSTAVSSLAILAVAVIGLALVLQRSGSKQPLPTTQNNAALLPSGAPIKSIAVLPFKPLIATSRDEALELGMADTLITRLSNLKEITVRPTSAVRRYTALQQDAVAAGREMKVESVLEGIIQRVRDRVRVSARLLRTEDGTTLWAETFDEKFTNIFAVQDSMSERVAGALAVKLSGEEKRLLTKRYASNAEAYHVYLKGRYYVDRRTEESAKKAIENFNQAIEIDPGYALAYAGLADAYQTLSNYHTLPPKEAFPIAKAAALKALELDDTLAEGHLSLAEMNTIYFWDWPEAERRYERAIELNPNYAAAHREYGFYHACMGRFDEAIAELKRAEELDPLTLKTKAMLGWVLYAARRYDPSIEQLRKIIDLDPNFVISRLDLGLVYAASGMHDEAIEAFQKTTAISGNNPDMTSLLGYAYALAGKQSEAQRILDELNELSKRRYVPPFSIAVIYIGLGQKNEAFKSLERAYEDRNWHLAMLKVIPLFDPLRSDPRFNDLLRRVGLPL